MTDPTVDGKEIEDLTPYEQKTWITSLLSQIRHNDSCGFVTYASPNIPYSHNHEVRANYDIRPIVKKVKDENGNLVTKVIGSETQVSFKDPNAPKDQRNFEYGPPQFIYDIHEPTTEDSMEDKKHVITRMNDE